MRRWLELFSSRHAEGEPEGGLQGIERHGKQILGQDLAKHRMISPRAFRGLMLTQD